MILFVDDERRRVSSYVEELEDSGYTIEFQTKVDDAWNYFEEHVDEIELLILDIMMSPGRAFQDEDTDGGLRTGVHFYERVRDRAPYLPVMVFTNASPEAMTERFRGEENCWYMPKTDYLPYEIAREIRRILASPFDQTGGIT